MTTGNTTTTPRRTLTALRAAWLFDGTGAQLIPDPTVVLDGDKILAVGSSLPAPEGAEVVELAGATVLPGLVDAHVHTVFDGSLDPVATLAERDDAAAYTAMVAAARQAAKGGVTTMRDLGDRTFLSLGLRDAVKTDPTLPHLLVAGPPITTPGGHCHFLGEGVSGVDGLKAAIAERAERGVDVVKIMASGGNMTPGSRPELAQYGEVELRTAVEEAHRHGLPITAHAHGTQAIIDAVAAGIDGLEHVTFMNAEGVDEIPEEVMRALVERQVTLSLTMGINPAGFTVDGGGPPPGMMARMPAMMANLGRLYQAGAFMVVGSDAGIAPIKPADAVRWGPNDLLRIGMSPAEGLRACTSDAAKALGLGDRKGRVAAGYEADLLVIDGDPLADPAAIHRIKAVYLRGNRIV